MHYLGFFYSNLSTTASTFVKQIYVFLNLNYVESYPRKLVKFILFMF
jgi:hypothetical protein